jgi:hypothetical protein
MVWGKDRCGAACVRGQLYFRRMRVIRTEKMLIENADMIVCETIHAAQTQPNRNPDLASAVEGARGARPRRGEGRAADLKRLYLAAGACVGVGCPPPPGLPCGLRCPTNCIWPFRSESAISRALYVATNLISNLKRS